MIDDFYSSRYKIKEKLGEGNFGAVCSALDTARNRTVALKLEHVDAELKRLQIEAKIYQAFNGAPEIPKFYGYSTETTFHVLSMELMGPSLEKLMKSQKKQKLSAKTVLMLADQMVSCIEFIHRHEFIHRDIKPDNFCMGIDDNENKVFLLDFGIMKYYIDQRTRKHIDWCDGLSLSGTARYASIDALKGIEQSRRDDMEALGYVFVYLMKGTLPWSNVKAEGKDERHRYDGILQMKMRTRIEDLCKDLPDEFVKYFKLVKKLKFEEEPDYALYRQLFRNAMIRLGYQYDSIYDWTDPKKYKDQKKSSKKKPKKHDFGKTENIPQIGFSIPEPESPKKGNGKNLPVLMENPNNVHSDVMIVPKMKNTGFKPFVPSGRSKEKKFAEDPLPASAATLEKPVAAIEKNVSDGFVPPPQPPNIGGKPPKKLDLNEKLGGLVYY